jgi:hypothetical protein
MASSEFNSYSALEAAKTHIKPILVFHLHDILKSIKRRITTRLSLRDQRKITYTCTIHLNIFHEFFRAVRDFRTAFGAMVQRVTDKKNILKTLVIEFSNIYSFKLHIKELDNKINIFELFTKSFPAGVKGNIVLSEEKPLRFEFNVKRHILKVTCHYEIKNRYGNVV